MFEILITICLIPVFFVLAVGIGGILMFLTIKILYLIWDLLDKWFPIR